MCCFVWQRPLSLLTKTLCEQFVLMLLVEAVVDDYGDDSWSNYNAQPILKG